MRAKADEKNKKKATLCQANEIYCQKIGNYFN